MKFNHFYPPEKCFCLPLEKSATAHPLEKSLPTPMSPVTSHNQSTMILVVDLERNHMLWNLFRSPLIAEQGYIPIANVISSSLCYHTVRATIVDDNMQTHCQVFVTRG